MAVGHADVDIHNASIFLLESRQTRWRACFALVRVPDDLLPAANPTTARTENETAQYVVMTAQEIYKKKTSVYSNDLDELNNTW